MAEGRKRRGRGEGGLHYDEGRGLWCGSVSLGYKGDGRRHRLKVYAATKRECLERMDAEKAKARAGVLPDAGRLTVGQLLCRWLEAKRAGLAARTHEERENTVNAHLLPMIGSAGLSKFTPLHVEGLYADMARDGVKPSRARHAGQCLTAALRHAVRLRLIAASPAAEVPPPPIPAREMLCLDPAQAKLLLVAAAGRPCHPLVATALGTGLRQGELLALSWPDADLDSGTLTVRRALSWTRSGGFEVKEPKTRASRRTVTLPPFVIDALAARRAMQLRLGLIRSPIFCTASGGYVFRGNVSRSLKAVIDRANDPGRDRRGGRPKKGVPKVTRARPQEVIPPDLRFHDLRHSHASLLLSEGCSVLAISKRLGHSKPSVTLNLYGHLMPGDDARLADAIGTMIG